VTASAAASQLSFYKRAIRARHIDRLSAPIVLNLNIELERFTFSQRAVAIGVDLSLMNEYVALAVIAGDEAKAFFVVEAPAHAFAPLRVAIAVLRRNHILLSHWARW